jgi:mannose-1-phosphate guanylyltransferase
MKQFYLRLAVSLLTLFICVSFTHAQRVTDLLVALYTFDEGSGSTVNDVSGVSPALNLTIQHPGNVTWLSGGGLKINSGTIIKTPGAATRMYNALNNSGEFTMEAWVNTSSTSQSGPARIATMSSNTTNRNFMLGQENGNYVARLRTTGTDSNGTPTASISPAVKNLQHVVYTWKNGTERFYLNGQQKYSGTRSGALSNWSSVFGFALGNEFTMDRAWLGELFLVAVYCQELSSSEVNQNFDAGPGIDYPVASLTSSCTLSGYETTNGRILWLPAVATDFRNSTPVLVFDQYSNGTARLYGRTQRIADSGKKFDVDVWFKDKSTYAQWIAAGGQIKEPQLGDETTWTFYNFDSRRIHKLIGVDNLAGTKLFLYDMPENTYGLQIGNGANALNNNPNGFSTWFDHFGTFNDHGDFNATLNCQNTCQLTVNAGPDRTICPGESVSLTASATGASSCSTPGVEDCNHTIVQNGGYITDLNTAAVCGENAGAKLWTAGGQGTSFITVDLGSTVPAGTQICVRMKLEHCSGTGQTQSNVTIQGTSSLASSFSNIAQNITFSSSSYQEYCYSLASPARFIKVIDNGSCSIRVDYVKYITQGSAGGSLSYSWSGPGISGNNSGASLTVSQTGTYTVTVTDCAGCTTTDQVVINASTACEPEEICDITGYDSPTGRVFWIPEYGTDFRPSFQNGGVKIAKYADGRAHIYGTVERISNPNQRFAVSLWFDNRSTYAQWIAQGGQAHSPELGDETTWIYYDFSTTLPNTLIGQGSLAGITLNLVNMSNVYGLQLGNGANALNTNANGISTWFSYTGSSSGNGDINGTYTCQEDCQLTVNAGPDLTLCPPQTLTLTAVSSGGAECSTSSQSDCNHPIVQSNGYIQNQSTAGVCGDNAGAKLWTAGGQGTSFLTVDFGTTVPVGTEVCVRVKLEHCSGTNSSSSSVKIEGASAIAGPYFTLASALTFSHTSFQEYCYTITSPARYIKVTDNGQCSIRLDYVKYTTQGNVNDDLTFSWSGPGITGNPNAQVITVNQPGTYTVVVTDCLGCSATDEVVVGSDDVPPVFDQQQDTYSLTCGDNIPMIVPTATDNFGNVELTYEDIQICSGNVFYCDCTFIRQWTAEDDCGNTATFNQVFVYSDDQAPTLVGVPANVTVECSDIPEVPVVTATDNCDQSMIVEFEETISNEACNYTITRVWTVSDDCGNTASATQVITTFDETPPVFVNVPLTLSVDCEDEIPSEPVFANDNCDEEVMIGMNMQTVPADCGYQIIRTYIAMDDCGNTASIEQVITVTDTEAPVLIGVPADITVECTDVPNPALVSADDNCDMTLEVVFTETQHPLSCGYQIIRTWSVADDCDNIAMDSQTITVVDTVDPVVEYAPAAEITIECDEDVPADMPIFSDACDEELTLSAISGITNVTDCGYDIERSWTATDDCGNSTTVSQIVHVEDTTAPVLVNVPANATVECDAIPAPSTSVSATDNCSDATVTYSESSTEGCPYTITRTWTATDACGNSSSASQVLTVVDTTDPVLVGVPADATVECSEIPAAAVVTATDNCDETLTVTLNEVVTSGTCTYYIYRTWSVTDDCGNTATATQMLTVVDTTSPVLVGVPANVTVECDAIPAIAVVTVTDNCTDELEIGFNEAFVPQGCNFQLIRTWTVFDDCQNMASLSQIITVVDTTAPVLVGVPADETIECTEEIADAIVSATDNCDEELEVVLTAVTEDQECGYLFIRTWTVTDDCGNTSSASQTITVVDTVDPVVEYAPAAEITIECDEDVPADMPIFSDACDEELTLSAISGITNVTDCGYDIERSWTATDDCGNSTTVSQIVHVEDTTAPVLVNVPANATVECDAIPAPSTSVSATDNCSDATVTYSESSTEGCPYTITRTWTATDACGNSSSASQVLTVVDTTDPVLVGVPADATVECSEIPAAAVVTATDNCDETLTVTLNEVVTSGTCTYYIYRTWSVTDDCGNTATATQMLTVVDTTSPVLVGVPANVTVECDAIPAIAVVTVTDNCTDELEIGFNEAFVPQGCNFQLIRTWTVFDDCQNMASLSQIITVVDTTAPVLVGVPADETIECTEEIADAIVSATDNCDEELEVVLTAVTEDQECGYLFIRTWTVTDDCGNTSSASQTITVVDTVDPVVEYAPEAEITIECDEDVPADMPIFSDACDEELTLSAISGITNVTDCGYDIERSWTATDDCGNSTTVSQIVHVEDTTAPVLVNVPANATVECDAIPAPSTSVTATDNCSDATVTYSESSTEGCPYTITRTWTATDACGNSSSASQVLTVVDTTDPVLVGVPADATVECSDIPAAAVVTATDNCDETLTVTLNEVVTSGTCTYYIYRTWSVTDDCGNTATATQMLTVVDTTSPVLVGVPANVTVECDAIPAIAVVTATDNCTDELEIGFNEAFVPQGCNFQLIRTWTVFDDCQNMASLSQIITVVDTTAPVLVGVPADETIECTEDIADAIVSATDNCDAELEVVLTAVTEDQECGYLFIRTWTVTDDCGNTSSASQTITVVDTVDPVVEYAPAAEITIECDEDIPADMPIFSDACDEELTLSAISGITNVTDCGYDIERSWTATDDCGNSTTVSQIVHVEDTTAPVLVNVPANATVECDAIPAPSTSVSATDNCSDATVTYSESSTEGCPYTITRTWTATDACGNSSSASQVLTVVDTTDPVLVGVPADATVECSDIPAAAVVTATDNCDETLTVTLNEVVTSGTCTYYIYRTWSVTDDCGNTATATQMLTVVDTTSPVLVGVPEDATVECTDIPSVAEVMAEDNCDDEVEVAFDETILPLPCGYQIVRSWTAFDDCQNESSSQQVITVIDTEAPFAILVSPNQTVECGSVIPSGVAIFDDACDGELTFGFEETTESGDCGYTINRVWSATDNCGNTGFAYQTITVVDTTAPVIEGVIEVEMACDDIDMTIAVTASDACDTNVEISFTDELVSGGCAGRIIRTYVATDDCGNSDEFVQIITLVDETAPVIEVMPENMTVECDQDIPGFEPVFSDNCDEELDVSAISAIVQLDCGYQIQRSWTATDDCENEITVSQTITVVDTTAPVLSSLPSDATYECTEVPAAEILTASDNCDQSVEVEFTEVITPLSCGFEVVRTWTATDECGNEVTHTQTITAADVTAPVISGVPSNITIECGQAIPAPSSNVMVMDNCDNAPDLTVSDVEMTDNCAGYIVRTWTATDACGNSSEAVQLIFIEDTTAPEFITQVQDVTVNCDELPEAAVVEAIDACDQNVTITFDEILGEGCPYTITRTWTATDDCGNEAMLVQVISVVDNEAPVFNSFPIFTAVECDEVAAYLLTASDNCDAEVEVTIVSELVYSGQCYGTMERVYRATDNCGNFVEAVQLIDIIDTEAPQIFNVPADVTIECGQTIPSVAEGIYGTDNCDIDLEVTFTQVQTNDFCPFDIIRTWTVTDECGNQTQGVQVIHVTVETQPMFHLSVYPNPTSGEFIVEFSVPQGEKLDAGIYDVTGRLVSKVFSGEADGGRLYKYRYSADTYEPGTYTIRVDVDGQIQHTRFVVAK